ncbi:MAG: Cdc6/Cdc18 family protein [Promethearchaeota archaeon]
MEKNSIKKFSFENAFNNLLRNPSLFIDERFFNANYPVEIIHRSDELNELLFSYQNLILKPESSKGINRFVVGRNGVGKTATIRFFCEDFIEKALDYNVNLKYIHISCKREQTWYKILITIIRNFEPRFPSRGHAPQEILDLLEDYLITHNLHLLIVLDDLDYLLKKDCTTLYCLTRINEGLSDYCNLISIIAIVKEIPLQQSFFKEIRPYFHGKDIEFENYTKYEIYNILNYRIKRGLSPNVMSNDLVEKIAEVVHDKEDIRYGLNLIWEATKLAESKHQRQITYECINLAENKGSYISVANCLESMSADKLLLLLSVIRTLYDNKGSYTYVNPVIETYISLCKIAGLTPKSYAQIWHYLQNYKNYHLISVTAESEGIRGRKNKITILNDSISKFEQEVMSILESKGILIES